MIEYDEFAKYYDLLYSDLDRSWLGSRIRDQLHGFGISREYNLLDAACGTGQNMLSLSEYFHCKGFDISSSMIEIARKNYPDIYFEVSDMRTFSFNEKFDVITCLFNSMNYLDTVQDLEQTIKNFSDHLKPGGVLFAELFHDEYGVINQYNHLRTYDGPDFKIARIAELKSMGEYHEHELNYMISKKGDDFLYKKESHKIKVFPKNKIISLMKKHKLKVDYLDEGYYGNGLFIGMRRGTREKPMRFEKPFWK